MAKDIVLRSKKFINNRLLSRKQCTLEIFHPNQKGLSIKDIKAKVSDKFGAPVDNISLFSLETKFGGGKSVATCLIYDSVDQKIKIEPRHRLLRDGHVKKTQVLARKAKKTIKTKCLKLRGKAVTVARKGK